MLFVLQPEVPHRFARVEPREMRHSSDAPLSARLGSARGARGFASQGFTDAQPAAGMFAVLAADVNADQKPDLVLGTQYNGYVLVYRNDTPTVAVPRFVRGDANTDGTYNIADAIKTLSMLFAGAGPLACAEAGDANDDGALSIADAIYTLGVLFAAAKPPSSPYPACGADPTKDELGCAKFTPCP
jgi:hypothetical protein